MVADSGMTIVVNKDPLMANPVIYCYLVSYQDISGKLNRRANCRLFVLGFCWAHKPRAARTVISLFPEFETIYALKLLEL